MVNLQRGSFQVKPLQKFRDYRSIPPSYKDTIQYKQMKLGSSLEEQNVIKKERSQFIDFLSYMLVIEPQDRHSAEMLLQHPFITVLAYSRDYVQKNDSQYCPIVSGNYEGSPSILFHYSQSSSTSYSYRTLFRTFSYSQGSYVCSDSSSLSYFRIMLCDRSQDLLFGIKVRLIQFVQRCPVFHKELVCMLANQLPSQPRIKELLYRHITQLMVIQHIRQMGEGIEGQFIILLKQICICNLSGIISVSLFCCFLSLLSMQKRTYIETDCKRKRTSTEKKQRSIFCQSFDYRGDFRFLPFSIG